MTYSHLRHFMYFDYYFSQGGYKAFYSFVIAKGVDMLPKRSTHVDQKLGSESTHSQLSVAIFRALRNLLVTQKSLMYFQTCQKGGNPCIPPARVSKTRDIRENMPYWVNEFSW